MSLPPSQPAAPLDAKMAAFRQQAAALVAQERGLTPACRVKLAELARSLEIGDDALDAALRLLAGSEPTPPPNPQAERLRARLRKDWAGQAKLIIHPAVEDRIVALATQKYKLNEVLARQVLGEVAAELGFTRITASDALAGLVAQMDETIGDSTWLAREAWDRLRSVGLKWGLELEVIDGLIDERLAGNRAAREQQERATRRVLTFASVAAMIAAMLGLVAFLRHGSPRGAEPAAAVATSNEPRPPAHAAWWDVDLAIDLAAARARSATLASVWDAAAGETASQRAAAYERLIAHAASAVAGKDLRRAMGKVVAGWHALEPADEAADRLRAALVRLLPAIDAAAPATGQQLDVALWAAETLAAGIDRAGISPARAQALADALGGALGTVIDRAASQPARLQQARQHTMLAAYRQFAALAAKQPAAVSRLYASLYGRAEEFLDQGELLLAEAAFLAAALPAAGSEWATYRVPIARCASAEDPLVPLRLADALRRASDEELVAHLTLLLMARAGVAPKSSKRSDVLRTVRRALGGRSAALTAAERWLALEEEAAEVLDLARQPASDQDALLTQTVALAHYATLALALSQGEAHFAAFDALAAKQPERALGEAEADRGGRLPPPRREPAALSARRQRELERFVETLSDLTSGSAVERLSALRGLVGLAEELPDLPVPVAERVAAYLLAAKPASEQTRAVQAASDLARHKRLRLAVADGLAASKLTAAQQSELAMALARGATVPPSASAAELERLMIDGVLRDLDAEAAPVEPRGEGVAARAEVQLWELYRERAKLLGASPAELAPAATTSAALSLLVRPLAERVQRTADRAPAEAGPAWRAALDALAAGELQKTVAQQRLVLLLAARDAQQRLPQRAGEVWRIQQEAEAAFAAAGDVLTQLRAQEAAVLQVWLLFAPQE